MTANYNYIDHTADIAIEIAGNTYAELFIAALAGWKDSVIKTSPGKRTTEEKEISLSENSPEELVVSFLQELNYLFGTRKQFPAELNDIRIEEGDDQYLLRSVIRFSDISPADEIKTEIKAVTFHQLDIKKVDNVFRTLIVFDI